MSSQSCVDKIAPSWAWGNNSAIRALAALLKDLCSILSIHMAAQNHLTPVAEDQMPFSGLCWHQAHL